MIENRGKIIGSIIGSIILIIGIYLVFLYYSTPTPDPFDSEAIEQYQLLSSLSWIVIAAGFCIAVLPWWLSWLAENF